MTCSQVNPHRAGHQRHEQREDTETLSSVKMRSVCSADDLTARETKPPTAGKHLQITCLPDLCLERVKVLGTQQGDTKPSAWTAAEDVHRHFTEDTVVPSSENVAENGVQHGEMFHVVNHERRANEVQDETASHTHEDAENRADSTEGCRRRTTGRGSST